jgi:hypothetical protein
MIAVFFASNVAPFVSHPLPVQGIVNNCFYTEEVALCRRSCDPSCEVVYKCDLSFIAIDPPLY